MGVIKFGILFFFCFLLEPTCDASNPIPSVHDNQVCELCDKYLTLAIDYLQNEDNQNAFVEALHMTCSQIPPLQKQCLAMVDRYTQRFFTQVSLLKPHHICKSLNLCQPPLHSQGNCDACHDTVSQLLPKLKDPQTKLKIIRLLLKECKSLNNYQDKCKKMVFEYGPLMLADLENFLEKKDVCSILGVCPTHSFYVLPAALADS
ncbi:PREDICTED: prosaposin-like [Brassica oleracea var. oleracea]|uniref:prosaposin-like n=1 Tax=Brassica oleracea var. oleracea TaxID=109376 RepID=UPI0006A6C064|nr:PREDICTED: prosaposin-like [Brassica oleracea var. oleracea]